MKYSHCQVITSSYWKSSSRAKNHISALIYVSLKYAAQSANRNENNLLCDYGHGLNNFQSFLIRAVVLIVDDLVLPEIGIEVSLYPFPNYSSQTVILVYHGEFIRNDPA